MLQGVRLPLGQRGTGLVGRRVVLGIRPDDIMLGEGGIWAVVGVTEPTGSETLINMTVGTEAILGVFKERLDVQPGEQIALRFDPARVHLFDAQTKLRLDN